MSTNPLKKKWDEIEAGGYQAGVFRVYPDSSLDFFLGYSIRGEREFTLRASSEDFQRIALPTFENIKAEIASGDESDSLRLTLKDVALSDLFSVMCLDLAEVSSSCGTRTAALLAFEARLARWSRLLKQRAVSGMTFSEQLGLLGELAVIRWLIFDETMPPEVVVAGWRGAHGDDTDIGLNGVRIEVKSQLVTNTPAIKVSSLDQLASNEADLYLVHCQFSPSDIGLSLAQLVGELEAVLESNPESASELSRKLCLLSFDHDAPYAESRYMLSSMSAYFVGADFPRLVPGGVSEGISNVRYEVSCHVLGRFSMAMGKLGEVVHG